MKANAIRNSRRELLIRGAGLLGGLVATLILEANTPAAAKAAKSDFLYQDHRHDGKGCGDCRFFSPDSGSPTTGTCAVVEGVVNRNGWCLAYSPKE